MQTQPEAADLTAMAEIDAAAIAGAKQTLRKAILFRRDARSNRQREHDDGSRMSQIESALEDRIPDTVAAYLSHGSSPPRSRWWPGSRPIKSACLLPVLSHPIGGRLDKPAWQRTKGRTRSVSGRTRSWSPRVRWYKRATSRGRADHPRGIGSNLHGDRLGRGGGWYDRACGTLRRVRRFGCYSMTTRYWKRSRCTPGTSASMSSSHPRA